MSSNLDLFDEPTRQVVPLLPLTGSQRLHLVQGSPWKGALGALLADGPDVGFWSAPRGYARGDLLLTVLDTEPRMLLCLERASTEQHGKDVEVEGGRVVFRRLVAVPAIEQLEAVSLPRAPATLSGGEGRAVLDALESELSNPRPSSGPDGGRPAGTSCSIPTGWQAAALLVAEGKCHTCGRDFGSLLGGQGIAGLEVHQLADEEPAVDGFGSLGNRLVVLCGGCHLLAHSIGSPSVATVRFAWCPSCPQCGAHPPNEILWGMPIWPVDDPHITIGGCVVDEQASRWHCRSCDHRWGSWA